MKLEEGNYELWKDREAERWVKSSCNDPSRAQRIVPITFLMIMKNLIRVNRWVHTRPSSALQVHLSSSVLVTYLKCT